MFGDGLGDLLHIFTLQCWPRTQRVMFQKHLEFLLMFQNKNFGPPKPRTQTSLGCIYLQILRNIYLACALAPIAKICLPFFLITQTICCLSVVPFYVSMFLVPMPHRYSRPWSHNDFGKASKNPE